MVQTNQFVTRILKSCSGLPSLPLPTPEEVRTSEPSGLRRLLLQSGLIPEPTARQRRINIGPVIDSVNKSLPANDSVSCLVCQSESCERRPEVALGDFVASPELLKPRTEPRHCGPHLDRIANGQ